ncbi:Inner membrane metabolite transport protein YdjE [Methylobacterium crusticola]|uniref:Inner membrane metabolite transport protein YdjE n=1 Tax=Methylobacterium crusticola TaxID=1697972 RepID=A0ABQ4R3C2_9HYPH|nr:MFS transporter [Methylobacterium crusticola]GJD52137.1 Inner membrane metabolite transport protein YdjE [Methylobacterium crusticola]
MADVINAGARLDRLPVSRFHWRMLWLIAAGGFVDAFDVYLASSVVAAIVKDGFSDLAHGAMFVSSGFFGMLIGAASSGYLGDRYGRRFSYQANLAIFGAASLAACFAPSITVLIACRFVMGIGLGAELVVAAGTLCEFIPPSHRGRWGALLGMLINVGLPAANAAGYFLIPQFTWRVMFLIAGVGAFVVWILRKQMPESPRWLESRGRTAEAEATLARIEAEVGAQVGALPAVAVTRDLRQPDMPMRALFSRALAPRTFVAALSQVAVNVSVYGMIAWIPTFLVKQGLSVVQSLGFTTLMTIGGPFGALVGYLLADRIPRKTSMIGVCVVISLFALVYPHVSDPMAVMAVGFGLVSAIYFLVAVAFYSYGPELFPTALRLRGGGFANACGRLASITMPYVVVALFTGFGVAGVVGMVVTALALLAVSVALLPVEMRSTSLEEAERDGAEAGVAPLAARGAHP